MSSGPGRVLADPSDPRGAFCESSSRGFRGTKSAAGRGWRQSTRLNCAAVTAKQSFNERKHQAIPVLLRSGNPHHWLARISTVRAASKNAGFSEVIRSASSHALGSQGRRMSQTLSCTSTCEDRQPSRRSVNFVDSSPRPPKNNGRVSRGPHGANLKLSCVSVWTCDNHS